MKLHDRIKYFQALFKALQGTTSRIEKENIIKLIPSPSLKEDFNYILECLAGKHVFGYKYYFTSEEKYFKDMETWNVKELLEYLQTPFISKDLTEFNIYCFISNTFKYQEFLEPIVNRTLRLGIGNSLLKKGDYSPMLAKKYEGQLKFSKSGYYITEKLDGNRCIARYNGERWIFTSRNGKEMHVNFDMSGLPIEYVYDGEILSPEQVEVSKNIYDLSSNINIKGNFNTTSGIINSHAKNKNLVYNIFDYIDPEDIEKSYSLRRKFLNEYIDKVKNDVRILPVLHYYSSKDKLESDIYNVLEYVTNKNGEGIMINIGDAKYCHKRTDNLLKLKQVQTIDMQVIDYELGTGKYEGCIGSLIANINTDDGKHIECKIGSGLSDEQRFRWSVYPDEIISKIIEVSYFSLSQDNKMKGTNNYSLRFPRLKKIREDKNETSEY